MKKNKIISVITALATAFSVTSSLYAEAEDVKMIEESYVTINIPAEDVLVTGSGLGYYKTTTTFEDAEYKYNFMGDNYTKHAYSFDLSDYAWAENKIEEAKFIVYPYRKSTNETYKTAMENSYAVQLKYQYASIPAVESEYDAFFGGFSDWGYSKLSTANTQELSAVDSAEATEKNVLTYVNTTLSGNKQLSLMLIKNMGFQCYFPENGTKYSAAIRISVRSSEVLGVINSADNALDFENIIESIDDAVGIDTALATGNEEFVYGRLAGRYYHNLEEVKTAFEDAVADIYVTIDIPACDMLGTGKGLGYYKTTTTFEDAEYKYNFMGDNYTKHAYSFDLSDYAWAKDEIEEAKFILYPYRKNTNEAYKTAMENSYAVQLKYQYASIPAVESEYDAFFGGFSDWGYSKLSTANTQELSAVDSAEATEKNVLTYVNTTLSGNKQLSFMVIKNMGFQCYFPEIGTKYGAALRLKVKNPDVTGKINGAETGEDLKAIIDKYADLIGVDKTDMPVEGYAELAGKNYIDIDEFKAAFIVAKFNSIGYYPVELASEIPVEKEILSEQSIGHVKSNLSDSSADYMMDNIEVNKLSYSSEYCSNYFVYNFDVAGLKGVADEIESAEIEFYPYVSETEKNDIWVAYYFNHVALPEDVRVNVKYGVEAWENVYKTNEDRTIMGCSKVFVPTLKKISDKRVLENITEGSGSLNFCIYQQGLGQLYLPSSKTEYAPKLKVTLPDYDVLGAFNSTDNAGIRKYLLENYAIYFGIDTSDMQDEELIGICEGFNNLYASVSEIADDYEVAKSEKIDGRILNIFNSITTETDANILYDELYEYKDELAGDFEVVNRFDDLTVADKSAVINAFITGSDYKDIDSAISAFTEEVNKYKPKYSKFTVVAAPLYNIGDENGGKTTAEYMIVKKTGHYSGDVVMMLCSYYNNKLKSVQLIDEGLEVLKNIDKDAEAVIYHDFECNYMPQKVKMLFWNGVDSMEPVADAGELIATDK